MLQARTARTADASGAKTTATICRYPANIHIRMISFCIHVCLHQVKVLPSEVNTWVSLMEPQAHHHEVANRQPKHHPYPKAITEKMIVK
jgi:hypothetical protein